MSWFRRQERARQRHPSSRLDLAALWEPDEDLNGNWVDCLLLLRVVPHDGGDLPFEAAVTTRRSKGALKVNLHRALKALRGKFGRES